MELRYDRVALKATRTDEGYILDTPVLTRTGVFDYRAPDGSIRREYRPPDVVFAADSLAGYKGKPITDGHPGKVLSKNVKQHIVGTIMSDGRQDDKDLQADIIIHDPSPIAEGKKELSCGYEVVLDETPGVTPDGEKYDAVQTSIKMNHLALVKRGRAGNARLNLDAADADFDTEEKPIMDMVKVRLDSGISYDAAPEVAHELTQLRKDAADAKTAADKALVDAQAATDREKARADAAEAEVRTAKEAIDKAREDAKGEALARVKLESAAKEHGVEIKQDMADKDIRLAVIKKVRGDSFDATDKSDAYIEASYDLAVTEKATRADALGEQRKDLSPRHDSGNDKPKSASSSRQAMIDAQRNHGSEK